jgi:hypothetical protein
VKERAEGENGAVRFLCLSRQGYAKRAAVAGRPLKAAVAVKTGRNVVGASVPNNNG